MPFCTTLETAHVDRDTWRLTKPLVWRGSWQYIVIRSGFETDFASIPKPVRWLLDNAGANAEAGVLHDAAWRESKRDHPRIDPWFADGMLRKALRETGSTALTRALIWFGVRITATLSGRFGRRGPSLPIKLGQLVVVLLVGSLTALAPTVIAGVGLVVFWIWNWLFAVVWLVAYERRHHLRTNWPWPVRRTGGQHTAPPAKELLVIVPFQTDPYTKGASPPTQAQLAAAAELTRLLEAREDVSEELIDRWVA